MQHKIAHHYYPTTTQVVAVGLASAASTNAFGAQIHAVRVVSTQPCHIVFDGTPTATTNDMLIPANVPEIFTIRPGQKIAAIKVSGGTDGSLYVTELTG